MVFGERRGDTVPGGMRPRVATQKQNRRSRTAVPDPKRRLGQLDCLKPETFEHQVAKPWLRPEVPPFGTRTPRGRWY
jgi:hypothetical protein